MCFVAGTMVHCANAASGEMYLLPIEQVREGQLVWSRDEKTGELGIKKVIDTFVTNPSELFHLNIDVNGNSESDETLTGTGEHPFYLSSRPEEGFFPMRELLAGDYLVLASGKSAQVLSLKTERGPPKRPFTTYNFEVEDFHTYFVGEAGVWVHNTGRAPCETIFSVYDSIRRELGWTLTQVRGNRSELVRLASRELSWKVKQKGTILSDFDLSRATRDVCEQEFTDFASGKFSISGNSVGAFNEQIKTVDWWNTKYFDEVAEGKAGWDVHHVVEDQILKDLGLSDPNTITGIYETLPGGAKKRMDVPGFVIKAFDNTNGNYGPFHQHAGKGLSPRIKTEVITQPDPASKLQALKTLYESPDFADLNMWPSAREWLRRELLRNNMSTDILP